MSWLSILHNDEHSKKIELELERYALSLGLSKNSEDSDFLNLAVEFVNFNKEKANFYFNSNDSFLMNKAHFFTLADLMFTIMAESANSGINLHGGVIWKKFASAVYSLKE